MKKLILEMGLFLVNHFLNAVEHRNMFWHLEKVCMNANNLIRVKIVLLVIYKVLLHNSLDRVAMFFCNHSCLEIIMSLSKTIFLIKHFNLKIFISNKDLR